MIKSVAALKLFASSMQDEDILRSLYVLSFNDIPNKDFSIKEAITRRADAKEKLNLVERQLIAKEVCTVLKNASALFDSELANITNNANNFIQPKNPEFIKSAKFGLLANVNGKYHLVNPLTNRVASEFIIEAADERYAKLHELVGQYRKENKISYFDESDGMMVLTGSPEVINDLEHKVKDIGYYCEAVNEETGAESEIPEYSLKVFIDKVASSASKVSKISSFSKISELRDSKVDFPNPIEDKLYETKDVLVEFGAHSFDTPDTPLVKNEIGGFSDLVYVIEKKIDNSIVPVASQYVVYNDGGYGLSAIKYHTSGESISEDDMSRAISAINQDFGKRFSKFESDSNSKDLQIKDIDTTNTNLEKDNPMLKHEGVTDEVVEKTSAEKPVEKKAEEKIDFEKELMEAGESKGKKDKVNKEQLAMGKEVEKEHTTNPEIAEKITRDHLAEIPDYYTHLKEMEDNAKKNNEVKSSYAPFMTVDATKKEEIKIYSGDHFIGTCKTITAAFEKVEEAPVEEATKTEVTKTVEDAEDNVWVVKKTSAPTIDDLLTIDIFYVVNKNTHVVAHGAGFEPLIFPTQEDAQKHADKLNSQKEASAKPEVKKEADNHLEQLNDLLDFSGELIQVLEKLRNSIRFIEKDDKYVDFDSLLPELIESTKNTQALASTFLSDIKIVSSNNENINKKAYEELKQFDMKQELDGQKEFEKQDDSLKDVSIPEEKEDTSEVNEAMSAKPTQNKGESFSASEFGNNLAYIKQNNPEDFESIMANLKQLMVGDQKPMYDFLELWSQNNFQNFTETTRVDPTYERHSQYQEQLKNNVLPKVMEMSEYKKAMEEKVSAEKGNVESAKEENIEKKAEKETKEEYVDSEGHTHTIITKVDKNREHPYIFEHLIDGQWASTSYNDFPVDLKEEIEHIKRVYPINPEGN